MYYESLAEEFMTLRLDAKRMRLSHEINKDVSGEEYVLRYLSLHQHTAFPKELSDGMKVSTARIACILNRLENEGFITRRSDESDSRKVIVELTPEGEERSETQHRKILFTVSKLFERMGPDDAFEYVRLQKKVLKCIADSYTEEE